MPHEPKKPEAGLNLWDGAALAGVVKAYYAPKAGGELPFVFGMVGGCIKDMLTACLEGIILWPPY